MILMVMWNHIMCFPFLNGVCTPSALVQMGVAGDLMNPRHIRRSLTTSHLMYLDSSHNEVL